jgi:hypothetical protein
MATPAFRAASSAGGATAANVTLSNPAGTADGDWLVVVISKDDTASITAPAGGSNLSWTLVHDDTQDTWMSAVYVAKWTTGSTTSHTFTFTSVWRDCIIAGYSGARSTLPIDPSSGLPDYTRSASATSLATNSITTETNDVRVVGAWTNFAGDTWQADANSPAMTTRATQGEVVFRDYELATAGATGAKTAQVTSQTSKMKAILLGIASLESYSLEQEGARFRNDDGNETAATWAAAQDANVTAPAGTNLRLRLLANATGDPPSQAYRLDYKKSTDSTYRQVRTSQPSAVASFGAAGAVAVSAASGASVAPVYPAAGTASRYTYLLIIGQKPTTANGGTVTTPTGWTQIGSKASGGGYVATLGADTGNTNLYVYAKDTITGSEAGTTLTVTVGDNNVCWGILLRVDSDVDVSAWALALASGTRDTAPTAATPFTITMGSDPGVQSGDLVVGAMCIPTDVTTPAQFTAQGFTQTGVTFGAGTEIIEPDSTTGNDIGGDLAYAQATAGTSSAAPGFTQTAAATITNVRGPAVVVRVRATAVQEQILVSPSTHLAASGAATTAQLTAPSGKTTSDFVAGRIQDDENPADAVDITSADYTELEWSLQAQSGVAQDGDIYQFRLTVGGTAFGTYTVTPEWTIGTAAAAALPSRQLLQSRAREPIRLYE